VAFLPCFRFFWEGAKALTGGICPPPLVPPLWMCATALRQTFFWPYRTKKKNFEEILQNTLCCTCLSHFILSLWYMYMQDISIYLFICKKRFSIILQWHYKYSFYQRIIWCFVILFFCCLKLVYIQNDRCKSVQWNIQ
jgi:hypothetical protein